jgi:hypothetical protein
MIDALPIWFELITPFSEKFFHYALIINICLTVFLILQNMRNYKAFQGYKTTNNWNSKLSTETNAQPGQWKQYSEGDNKESAKSEKSRLEHAIKMIRDGFSRQEIISSINVEANYIDLLFKHHKPKKG